MLKVKLGGSDELIKMMKEKQKLTEFKKVVERNGKAMEQKMIDNTSYFTGWYDSSGRYHPPTGATKKSISGKMYGLSYITGPTTYYSPYVNFGTSKMTPRPFVTDAFNSQKEIYKRELGDLV